MRPITVFANDSVRLENAPYTQLTGFVARGPPCLATMCYIKKHRIPLILYYTQLTGFVARGPRASQPCAISKNIESR